MVVFQRFLIGAIALIGFVFIGLISLSDPALALGGTQPPLNQPAPVFNLPGNGQEGSVSLEDYR
ncbi:MAG: peroxiredoxin, partial [Microcystaceae cyanobacterium]